MKTTKSILTAIIFFFVCLGANANVKFATGKPTRNEVVNMYIDAIAHGKTNNLNNVLDDALQFNILRGENVNTLDKSQVINYLKNNPVSESPASTNTAVAQEDDNTYVVKVDFKYADYTRTDVITVEKANGWVVTKVQSSYK